MSYGFELRDATGKIIYNTSTITWITLDTIITLKDVTVRRNYSGLSGFTKIRVHVQLLNNPPDMQEGYAPLVYASLSGDTATVYTTLQAGRAEQAAITVLVQ